LRLIVSPQRARGNIDVAVANGRLHVVNADVTRRQLVRVQLHVYRILERAEHLHLRYSVNGGNARADLRFGVFVQIRERKRVRTHGDVYDRRIGWIHSAVRGRRGHARRHLPDGLSDGGLHVLGGAIETAIQIKLQGDTAVAGPVLRGHRVQAGDRGEGFFQRQGHG